MMNHGRALSYRRYLGRIKARAIHESPLQDGYKIITKCRGDHKLFALSLFLNYVFEKNLILKPAAFFFL